MHIPTLKATGTMPGSAMSQLAESNQEKSHFLWTMFFPELMHSELNSLLMDYPRPRFDLNPVTNDQIHWAISKLGPHKAPRPDGILNVIIIQCADLIISHLGPLYCASLKLGVYLNQWRDSITVVIRKPSKSDYTVPNTYYPITLLNTMAKVLSACIAKDLVQMTAGVPPEQPFQLPPWKDHFRFPALCDQVCQGHLEEEQGSKHIIS